MKYQLNSGAKLEVNESSIQDCWMLYQSICNALKKDGLELPDLANMSFAEIIRSNPVAILNIFSDDEILEQILNCAKQAIYNGQRVNMDTFSKNRGDFFPSMQLIALVNLKPFFPEFHTVFQGLMDSILT